MVKSMGLKITEFINGLFDKLRNLGSLSALDIAFLRPFLILLAITILSYETVDLLYKILSFSLINQKTIVRSHVPSSSIQDIQKAGSIDSYGIVTERNLFLSTLKAVRDKESDMVGLDSDNKTANFDLKGTVACSSSFGYIFVEEHGSNKQKLYKLGDMIGSSKLVKITRNTATLRSGGLDTTIRVKATIEGQLLPDSPDKGSSPSRRMTLSRKALNDNLSKLDEIMKQAVFRPFTNKGAQEGFIISNIVPGSIYEKMGLREGDIIMSVNNKKIQSASNLLQISNMIQSGNNISINIKRNEREETINYTFE
jgi:general secretion pathway protein C